jgi:hypothetical protein
MLGWTIIFSFITVLSALWAALSPEPVCLAARSTGIVSGSLVLLCFLCVIAGNAARNSLR